MSKPAPQPPATPAPPARPAVVDHPAVSRAARPAAPRRRHRLAAISFLVCVVLPTIASILYLYLMAADQYASRLAFSVRSSEAAAPTEILGVLTRSIGGAGPDAEIIYEYVRSQQMVEAAEAALPLRDIFNRAEDDVVFRLGEDRSTEDLLDYWNWMTDVSYDLGGGVVDFEARAFDPESAQAIAAFVLEESTRLVNELSLKAREDAVADAAAVLAQAEDRLRDIRRELRAFRNVEQLPDPTENARASLGLVSQLERDLAETQIELDTQLSLVGERGPRVPVLRQKIASLRAQIASERTRLGEGREGGSDGAESAAANSGDRVYADLIADYEELVVDREFAEQSYVSALAAFERAQIEARRQMRYLAPHIEPTFSDEAQYPQRALLSVAIALLLIVTWAVVVLILYNVRDRR